MLGSSSAVKLLFPRKSFDFSQIPCLQLQLISISEILHESERTGEFSGSFHVKSKLILTLDKQNSFNNRFMPFCCFPIKALTCLISLSILVTRITITS